MSIEISIFEQIDEGMRGCGQGGQKGCDTECYRQGAGGVSGLPRKSLHQAANNSWDRT